MKEAHGGHEFDPLTTRATPQRFLLNGGGKGLCVHGVGLVLREERCLRGAVRAVCGPLTLGSGRAECLDGRASHVEELR